MKVNKLYLELTRMCTIECEHCLRGNRRNEFMSVETINNIFKDITEIDFLLLTGGEPLLALKQLKGILNVVKDNNIKINCILLVTNCTVLNEGIMNTLSELSSITDFELRLSYDMFHYMELTRLHLLEKRKENAEVFKEKFHAAEYSDYEKASKLYRELIYPIGRASTLSDARLDEINRMANTNYAFNKFESVPITSYPISYDQESNTIKGAVSIDVNGNVVSYSLPFDEEDKEANLYNSNVNNLGLLQATLNHVEYKKEKQSKKETGKTLEMKKNN